MAQPRYPSLYQINTRVWLGELSLQLGRPATLDDVGDDFFDFLSFQAFDWLWPLGVWQTGAAGREVSRRQPEWRREFEVLLPDLKEEDITGSPFAIQNYQVHADFGGDEALARFRQRLEARGVRLLLDFVPNHTALDHPWVWQYPEDYISGDENDLAREPHNYCRVETAHGPRILAHGRDPYFPGWPDTLQLNYRVLAMRQAMIDELTRIGGMCDGVRCDMAMLLLPDVIERTWGNKSLPSDGTPPIDECFWPEALDRVRNRYPQFLFMAEVYWDLEWALQQLGFDYTYDKRLYDRLHARDAEAVRAHLRADPEFQRKSVRFLENHDEPRAAGAFPVNVHQAAALITFLVPGLRFFHEGQLEGRRQRVSMHLGRRPVERVDKGLQVFYGKILETIQLPAVRDGRWQLLDCRPAWEGNPTDRYFIVFTWEGLGSERMLIAVNYGRTQGQCIVSLPWPDLRGRQLTLRDRMDSAYYERDGTVLAEHGLFLDMPEYGFHVFDVVSL